MGSLAPAGHPAGCFPWGNKVTLQDRVDDDRLHRAVRDFWLRHYSAHRMTLAVCNLSHKFSNNNNGRNFKTHESRLKIILPVIAPVLITGQQTIQIMMNSGKKASMIFFLCFQVVARLPLDTLEKFVRHSFSDVPNNNLPPLDLTPFRAQTWGPQFSCLLWVKPVYDLCEVSFSMVWYLLEGASVHILVKDSVNLYEKFL